MGSMFDKILETNENDSSSDEEEFRKKKIALEKKLIKQ